MSTDDELRVLERAFTTEASDESLLALVKGCRRAGRAIGFGPTGEVSFSPPLPEEVMTHVQFMANEPVELEHGGSLSLTPASEVLLTSGNNPGDVAQTIVWKSTMLLQFNRRCSGHVNLERAPGEVLLRLRVKALPGPTECEHEWVALGPDLDTQCRRCGFVRARERGEVK